MVLPNRHRRGLVTSVELRESTEVSYGAGFIVLIESVRLFLSANWLITMSCSYFKNHDVQFPKRVTLVVYVPGVKR
jgi:energy-converting hydrogenase Eha subunit H